MFPSHFCPFSPISASLGKPFLNSPFFSSSSVPLQCSESLSACFWYPYQFEISLKAGTESFHPQGFLELKTSPNFYSQMEKSTAKGRGGKKEKPPSVNVAGGRYYLQLWTAFQLSLPPPFPLGSLWLGSLLAVSRTFFSSIVGVQGLNASLALFF